MMTIDGALPAQPEMPRIYTPGGTGAGKSDIWAQ